MKNALAAFITFATSALMPAVAGAAGLTGTRVDVSYHFVSDTKTAHTLDSVVVGPAVEFTCPTDPSDLCTVLSGRQTVDLFDDSIRYEHLGVGVFISEYFND